MELRPEQTLARARANSQAYRARLRATGRPLPGADSDRASYFSAYTKANADRHCAKAAKRRAAKMKATPAWLTPAQLLEMEDKYRIARAFGSLDVDHIVPLKGKTVCGLHVPWNLQFLGPNENRSKGNRLTPVARAA